MLQVTATSSFSGTSPGIPPALLLEVSIPGPLTWHLLLHYQVQTDAKLSYAASCYRQGTAFDSNHTWHSHDSCELQYSQLRPLPPFCLVRIEAHYWEYVPPNSRQIHKRMHIHGSLKYQHTISPCPSNTPWPGFRALSSISCASYLLAGSKPLVGRCTHSHSCITSTLVLQAHRSLPNTCTGPLPTW